MWRIIKKLYLGDQQDSANLPLLHEMGITHILNCAYQLPCFFPRNFEYLCLELHDPDWSFVDHIPDLCRFIRLGRRQGGVLVHCRAGLSRSPAAVLAYLCSRGKTLEEAIEILKEGVGESDETFVEPDEVFIEQIQSYFEQ